MAQLAHAVDQGSLSINGLARYISQKPKETRSSTYQGWLLKLTLSMGLRWPKTKKTKKQKKSISRMDTPRCKILWNERGSEPSLDFSKLCRCLYSLPVVKAERRQWSPRWHVNSPYPAKTKLVFSLTKDSHSES
jgi:hypothetical protein